MDRKGDILGFGVAAWVEISVFEVGIDAQIMIIEMGMGIGIELERSVLKALLDES